MNMPSVIYSVSSWLPLTMNWIYNQIKYLDAFTPLILSDTSEGLDKLPAFPLSAIDDKNKLLAIKVLRKLGFLTIPAKYDAALKEFKPGVIHSHFGDRGWFDRPLVKKYHLKQVVTFYGYDLSLLPVQQPAWLNRFAQLFDQAHLFLCEGPFMAKSLVRLGCPAEKVLVQRLGVDVENIPYKPRHLEEDGLFKILISGRFIEKKGIPYALEAVGLLRDRFPNLRVTVIGDSGGSRREEREKTRILETLERHHLHPITRMLGFQPYSTLLKEAYEHHLFLSPSVTASDGDSEGGAPMAIIDMMATGMPVVSSKHCDIPEIVKPGLTGWLAEERDSQALASQIAWIIEHPERLEEMTRSGRRHIELEYNVRVQGNKLFDHYRNLS